MTQQNTVLEALPTARTMGPNRMAPSAMINSTVPRQTTCLNGQCIGNHDPCIDNEDYCDGVEYCEEGGDTYSCSSTGDPCDPLTCNESFDECEESDVILTITDAYGYAGTIDIEAKNCCNLLSSIQVDVCNIDQRPWLYYRNGQLQHHRDTHQWIRLHHQ